MSLILGQLIYTSFPRGGLKLLASEGISPDIREVFIERMTEHWVAQGPPKPGYRCAYIHQITPEKTLFGWIYNDEIKEDGRDSHVPYFIGYFLTGRLNPVKLKNIFALLEQGPPTDVNRQNPPEHLEPVVAPDLWDYQPTRVGVATPPHVYERSCRVLEKGGLIDYLPFIPLEQEVPASSIEGSSLFQQQPLEPIANKSASALGRVQQDVQDALGEFPWKPFLVVGGVCLAVTGLSVSFIFSSISTSNSPAGNDTAFAVDNDPQITALRADLRSKFSPEPTKGQPSLDAAKRIVAQVEKPLEQQDTQKLSQSVEARAKERLEKQATAPSSATPKAPKLSKKLAAALEKEPPPSSSREKARLKSRSKSKVRLVAQQPVIKKNKVKSNSVEQPSSIVVIDSSRETPLRPLSKPKPAPAPATPAPFNLRTAPDCYGPQARQNYQCRNRKN